MLLSSHLCPNGYAGKLYSAKRLNSLTDGKSTFIRQQQKVGPGWGDMYGTCHFSGTKPKCSKQQEGQMGCSLSFTTGGRAFIKTSYFDRIPCHMNCRHFRDYLNAIFSVSSSMILLIILSPREVTDYELQRQSWRIPSYYIT
jgi:hypothetical protein